MVDGLKLTVTGEELTNLLERRIESHKRSADRWKKELARTPEEATDDEPLLPDHICENETERHEWRAEVLSFIRDYVDIKETYRLSADDLAFGELLPDKPGWLDQEEYEERTRVGFELERLSKTAKEMTTAHFAVAARSNLDDARSNAK